MMRRFWLLWRKEWDQHRWFVLALGALTGCVLLVRWLNELASPTSVGLMPAAAVAVQVLGALGAFVLAQRVVVREYYAHTQLFLEALPMRRWEMVAAKWSFGLGVLVVLSAAAVLGMVLISGEGGGAYLGLAGLRVVGYCACVWSVCFTLGLLGRLRLAAYVVVLLTLFVLDATTEFEWSRFGPFELVEETQFAYERERVPTRALLEAAGLAGAFLGLGLGLSLVREGSVAEVLSRRASQREKSALTVLLVAGALLVATLGPKPSRAEFEFSTGLLVEHPRARVTVMYGWPELEPRARELSEALAEVWLRLGPELGAPELPRVRVAHSSVLGRYEVRDEVLSETEGILVKVNLAVHGFTPDGVVRGAVHDVLVQQSSRRALAEAQHWLLDGLATWWSVQGDPEGAERLWLHALVATRALELVPERVLAWEQLMEQVGEDGANALAFTGVALLAEAGGTAVLRGLLRELVEPSDAGLGAVWRWTRPEAARARFERVTGRRFAAFVREWRAELERRATVGVLAERLRALGEARAVLRAERGRAGSDVVYEWRRVSGGDEERASGDGDAGGEVPEGCSLAHAALPPYDLFVGSEVLIREPLSQRQGRLRGRYSSRQRVFAALECERFELGGRLRLAARRLVMP